MQDFLTYGNLFNPLDTIPVSVLDRIHKIKVVNNDLQGNVYIFCYTDEEIYSISFTILGLDKPSIENFLISSIYTYIKYKNCAFDVKYEFSINEFKCTDINLTFSGNHDTILAELKHAYKIIDKVKSERGYQVELSGFNLKMTILIAKKSVIYNIVKKFAYANLKFSNALRKQKKEK